MPDRSSVLSRWQPLHDEISVLVAAAPRKILAISANNLQDVFLPRTLRSSTGSAREPMGKIGYSIFIYDLTGDAEGVDETERKFRLLPVCDLPRVLSRFGSSASTNRM